MDSSGDKIARILRTDKGYFDAIEKRFTDVAGKKGIFDRILEENEALIKDRLSILGVPRTAGAKDVYDALISKVEADDHFLFTALSNPDCQKVDDCARIADVVRKIAGNPKGFFIKLDKAKELLIKQPPGNVMKALGYSSADEMVAKENIYELYSALRFVEGAEWLNAVFFKQYETLTPADFEEREVQVMALREQWRAAAKVFTEKKKHNISHLKELGVIFILPELLGISGEILRMFALLFHYLHEIPFYSKIFREIAKNELTFTSNFTSLLRGDVINRHFPDSDRSLWLVIQRYLSKDDANDWRLFVPHINPEAIHWSKATSIELVKAGSTLDHFKAEMAFWSDLGPVGDFFKDESGVDILVSFNIVDTVMSLVKEKDLVKYLYHHEEALWNRIFEAYFGSEELETYAAQYLLQGYFEV